MCLYGCIHAVTRAARCRLKPLPFPLRSSRRDLSILQRAALLTILRHVVFLPARYITLVLISEGVEGFSRRDTGRIRHNLQELSATVLLSLSHLYHWCLLVSVVCRSVMLAYSNKCATEADDAAALLKINCLL